MELFSNIIKEYKIICYDEFFSNLILKYFNIPEIENDERPILHIGLNKKIKIKNNINILILGPECDNPSFFGFLVYYHKKINFFTLSQIDANFYFLNHKIQSTIIKFDLPYQPIINKLYYFNRINYQKTQNNRDFLNYIIQCYNEDIPFFNITSLKIIIFEPLTYIQNPYVNILYTSFPDIIKICNFYKITANDYSKKLHCSPSNIIDKIHFYKLNFYIIYNFIQLISTVSSQFIYSTLSYFHPNLNSTKFIIISDNINDLQTNYDNSLKILISTNHIFEMKNKILHINPFFFNNNKKFDNIEANEFQFIITNNNDITHLQNYQKLFKKYLPNKKLTIFSNLNIPDCYQITDFKPQSNTKIFFSNDFNLEPYLNYIIFQNIEVQPIQKIHNLVTSTQYPSYGGAATNAYNLIKYFQKDKNIYTTGLFINIDDSVYDNCNPDNLENVIGLLYRDFDDVGIHTFIHKKFKSIPDIAFCKNSMAPKIIKKIFPNCIIIFLVSGIMGFSQIEFGANSITDFHNLQKSQEINSIISSNLIICNSHLTLNYYNKIYPNISNLHPQPIDTTKYNTFHISNQKHKKSIDIIVVASNVNRPVKNIKFIKQLFKSSPKLQNRKITIIGSNSENMFQNISKKITTLPLLSQQEVDTYLLKSKIILIPSLFDSNSNTFREAIYSNVIPFISINVAHPKKYPKFLILNNYNPADWDERINYTLDNYKDISQKYNLKELFNNTDNISDFII